MAFLIKSKLALSDHGLIIVKDNIAMGRLELDQSDNSVIREKNHLEELFKKAGLCIVCS
jgi:hypothetical protein